MARYFDSIGEYQLTEYITSVSNYFKTDGKYIEYIVSFLGKELRNSYSKVKFLEPAKILRRKELVTA